MQWRSSSGGLTNCSSWPDGIGRLFPTSAIAVKANLVPRVFSFSNMAVSRRFGHPHSQSPSVLGIPFSPSRTLPGCPNPQCFGHPLRKNSGFCGKIENVLGMDSAKYRNLFPVSLKEGLSGRLYKTRQNDSAKICQKVGVWLKIRVLVPRGQGEGWHSASTTCYHRGRESDQGLQRVPLCSFFWTRRPR